MNRLLDWIADRTSDKVYFALEKTILLFLTIVFGCLTVIEASVAIYCVSCALMEGQVGYLLWLIPIAVAAFPTLFVLVWVHEVVYG